MPSRARIQTAKAEFLDPALYDDSGVAGLPKISRNALLVVLSRAFDLAEGRRGGHAQRVAYAGLSLAEELGLTPGETDDVFAACLLHDVGMASPLSAGTFAQDRGARQSGATNPPASAGETSDNVTRHCQAGAETARQLGLSEAIAMAIASHHDSWDGSGVAAAPRAEAASQVALVVAIADRVETLIDVEGPPLLVRRRGPQLVREMAGSVLDPAMACRMAALAGRDDFWLGLYDRDLAATLMARPSGGPLDAASLFSTVGVLSDLVDRRNSRPPGRGRRIGELAYRMALACNLPERRADLVRLAALLQDIGTLGVPARYLSKPDILTIEEMAAVQLHPVFARDILSEAPGLAAAAWWVGCHHERIDGKGYPGMLEGDEVPLEAQVIGMCEAYEALISDRPYRRAMAPDEAMEVMAGLAGSRFDPYLVGRFEEVAAAASAA